MKKISCNDDLQPAGARRTGPAMAPAAIFAAGLLALVLPAACAKSEEKSVAREAYKSIEDRFPVKVGDRTVQAQVAVLPGEMQRGLMYRDAMGPDEGMIFVYASAQPQSFWMRNTRVPLDIGFFDAAGELKEVYPMYPLDERPVASHSRQIQYCLEMNQGWFRRAGVMAGAKLDLAAVAAALRARGLSPEAYGFK